MEVAAQMAEIEMGVAIQLICAPPWKEKQNCAVESVSQMYVWMRYAALVTADAIASGDNLILRLATDRKVKMEMDDIVSAANAVFGTIVVLFLFLKLYKYPIKQRLAIVGGLFLVLLGLKLALLEMAGRTDQHFLMTMLRAVIPVAGGAFAGWILYRLQLTEQARTKA
jgi:hypothetical protein